jgi:hypothetical protein
MKAKNDDGNLTAETRRAEGRMTEKISLATAVPPAASAR